MIATQYKDEQGNILLYTGPGWYAGSQQEPHRLIATFDEYDESGIQVEGNYQIGDLARSKGLGTPTIITEPEKWLTE